MVSRHIGKIILSPALLLLIAILTTCSPPASKEKQKVIAHKGERHSLLAEIRERGKLIATTDYNSTSYFVYRGEPMGYQYELLKSFASYLGVKLEINVNNDLEQAFNCLYNGGCDLIASDLTITKERSEFIDFTNPIGQTKQVLIQRKPANWRKMKTWDEVESYLIRNQLDLAGKTIHVQKNSSFIERLKNLEDEIGDTIYIIEDPHRIAEQLIRQVAMGEIDYTISDENVALVNQKYYSDIDIATPVSFPQHLAWAVGKGSDLLLKEINLWIVEFKRSAESRFIYNKYFKNPRSVKITQSEYHSVTGGKISMYDDVIKEQSIKLNWDWRLLASLVYQESGFNPDVRSWVGAFGLMQLMPRTAEKYGIDSLSSPGENIIAGVKFLKWLDNQFEDLVEDDQERIKFVMASYNVGIAHVFDAMRLAEKYDKDPTKWNGNVDYYLRNKSDPKYYNDPVVYYGYARGEEPYNFVNDIIERYDHYKNVIN